MENSFLDNCGRLMISYYRPYSMQQPEHIRNDPPQGKRNTTSNYPSTPRWPLPSAENQQQANSQLPLNDIPPCTTSAHQPISQAV